MILISNKCPACGLKIAPPLDIKRSACERLFLTCENDHTHEVVQSSAAPLGLTYRKAAEDEPLEGFPTNRISLLDPLDN